MSTKLCTIPGDSVPVWQESAGANLPGIVHWVGKANCDGDGANGQTSGIACYAPPGIPSLDNLADGGVPGDWWALVTNNGLPSGNPIIQGPADPAPGAYSSTTAYMVPGIPASSPLAYLDAAAVPFIVVNSTIRRACAGIALGAQAWVTRISTGLRVPCVVGDVGGPDDEGELSIALCIALGFGANPKGNGPANDEMDCLICFQPGLAAPGYALIRA